MQYAHKHDPKSPDDAELLNLLKSIDVHLSAIVSELSGQTKALKSTASSLTDINYSLARALTSFERWLPKP